jgi:hypothetical protein
MCRSRSNNGACSSYRIPISAPRIPACRAGRPAIPECHPRAAQLQPAPARLVQAQLVRVTDGIALESRFTEPVAARRRLRVLGGNDRRLHVPAVDRQVEQEHGASEAIQAAADKRFGSVRRLCNSVRPAIRLPVVVPATEAARAAAAPALPRGAAAVAVEQLMPAAAAEATRVAVGTEAADTAKAFNNKFLPSGSKSTSQRFEPFFFAQIDKFT